MSDFDDKTGIEQQKILQDKGYDITFIQVNVADRESVDNLVSKAAETYGGVDILVNNAGITRDAMLAKMASTDFQQVLDVNVTGVFNCTQAVLPYLLEKGRGKIINTSSVSGVYEMWVKPIICIKSCCNRYD